MRSRSTRLRCVAVTCGVALVLGAYSLDGAAAVAKSKSSSKVTVATAKVSGVGTVLVDSKGKTLYTLTNGGQAVPCTGACAAVWIPLLLAAGSHLKDANGVKGLGTMAGGQQVTAGGLPLYRFTGDAKKQQAHGEGINSFGGVWHVVKVAGATGTKTPSSTAKTPSPITGSHSGY
jgi:predicted lipoprotein with Yx(FWY)xxD motif